MQILIVEDDRLAVDHISSSLVGSGYDVVKAPTMAAARAVLAGQDIHAIVVDRMLGDADPVQQIADWRRQGVGVPILVVGASGGIQDRIAGLEAGADGYLEEPIHAEELAARLKALFRAHRRHAALAADVISYGSIRIDRLRRTADRDGLPLLLMPREYRLLETLCEAQGGVVSRTTLLAKVWKLSFDPRTKIIETHISRLRDKLDQAGPGEVIETVRGVGYRLRHDGQPDIAGTA